MVSFIVLNISLTQKFIEVLLISCGCILQFCQISHSLSMSCPPVMLCLVVSFFQIMVGGGGICRVWNLSSFMDAFLHLDA